MIKTYILYIISTLIHHDITNWNTNPRVQRNHSRDGNKGEERPVVSLQILCQDFSKYQRGEMMKNNIIYYPYTSINSIMIIMEIFPTPDDYKKFQERMFHKPETELTP